MIHIIDKLLEFEYYGGGKFIEFAKGSKEYVDNFTDAKIKIKRVWQLKK